MPFVYSTATCSGTYVQYAPDTDKNSGHHIAVRKVTINGGHGVATKHLVTPKGVVTQVTDDELNFLLADANFQRHVKAGFMTYDKKKVDPEKRAANMEKGDRSAPLTPDDFKEGEHSSSNNRIFSGKPIK